MTTKTSTLDLVVKNDASGPLKDAASAFLNFAQKVKATETVLERSNLSERVKAQVRAMGAGAQHVEVMTKELREYAKAQGLAADRSQWTKDQAANYRTMERAHATAMRMMIQDENRLAEERTRNAQKQAHIVEQQRHAMQAQGFGHLALSTAAGYASAHGIFSGMEYAAEKGSEIQHQLVGLRNAGRTYLEIAQIQKRSNEVIASTPTATMAENLKIISETTAAFGSVEHAQEHLGFMQKTMSVLHAVAGDKIQAGPGEIAQSLAKYYEERMRPPEDFEKEISAMIPAMVVSGGTFNPNELYAFAQQAKSALPAYDLDFLQHYAPSLIGANGGHRAGTAAADFDKVISGKARDAKQAGEWMRLGLLDPSQILSGKNGPIGWKAGAVKGTDAASQNPVRWAEEVLIPAMQRKGINVDDRLAVKNELATLFRNGTSNFFASEIVQAQARKRLHKDAALFDEAGRLNAIYWRNLREDPKIALGALKASIENLTGAATKPMMPDAANVLSHVAQLIDRVAVFADQHPAIATAGAGVLTGGAIAGAGWLAAKLAGGFGLQAAALELSGAAGLLSKSAISLTGGSAVRTGAAAATGAGAVEGAGAASAARHALEGAELAELAGGATLAGIVGGTAWLASLSIAAQRAGMGGAWSPATQATLGADRERLAGLKADLAETEAKIAAARANSKNPDALGVATMSLETRRADLTNQIKQLDDSIAEAAAPKARFPTFGPIPPSRDWRMGAEEFGPPMPKREQFGPPMPPAGPTVDPSATDAIFTLGQRAVEAKTQLAELNEPVSPQISLTSLDALIAKAAEAKAALAGIGSGGAAPAPIRTAYRAMGRTGIGRGTG